MYYGNHILEPCELQMYEIIAAFQAHSKALFLCFYLFYSQLDEIIRDETPPCPGEEHLAALTAGSRIPWAEAREKYFKSGVNRTSLEAIEKAAFVLVLDEEEHQMGAVTFQNEYSQVWLKQFFRNLRTNSMHADERSCMEKVMTVGLINHST